MLLPSAVIAADTNALPALIPAYGELPPTFWEQHQAAIIIASSALVAFAFLFLKMLLRPANVVILPPETVARQALAKLQSQPEDGKLLSAAAQILRRYIYAAFNLPSNELTTAEFCAAISTHETIGTELAGAIASFLRECDVRKFSPPHLAAPLDAANRALALISLAETRRTRPRPPVLANK
ncbi:MAG TPA: hypothetical protein VGI63_02005 [Verrucomicrobiae bacterium]